MERRQTSEIEAGEMEERKHVTAHMNSLRLEELCSCTNTVPPNAIHLVDGIQACLVCSNARTHRCLPTVSSLGSP